MWNDRVCRSLFTITVETPMLKWAFILCRLSSRRIFRLLQSVGGRSDNREVALLLGQATALRRCDAWHACVVACERPPRAKLEIRLPARGAHKAGPTPDNAIRSTQTVQMKAAHVFR